MYKYKATNLIAKVFDEKGIVYNVKCIADHELLMAGYGIDCGPTVYVHYLTSDNDNDVAVRIPCLISKIPDEKRTRVLNMCNTLNDKIRFVHFCIDPLNNLDMKYDLPESSPDEGLGEMAFEIFARTMGILDSEYPLIAKALYSDEELTEEYSFDTSFIQKLMELRRKREKMSDMSGFKMEHSDFDEDDFEEDIFPDDEVC